MHLSNKSSRSRNIVFTGLMGTGKTTIGRLVALELNRIFIDTDQYIETHWGKAADILNQVDGDIEFQWIEEQVAKELGSFSDLVISTGGRFLLCQNNIDKLKDNGDVLCLSAELQTIVNRLLASTGDTYRPRFAKATDKLALMRTLQASSAPILSQFEQISTDSSPPEEIARNIANRYR